MKRAVVFIIAALIALLWIGSRGESDNAAEASAKTSARENQRATAGETRSQRTKVSTREAPKPSPTHQPDQFRDFMLPEIFISGLTLEAALEKLRTAYEEACRFSGEIPHQLVFKIASDGTEFQLHLKAGNLDSSIRLLGMAAGYRVRRSGAEYIFSEIDDQRRPVHRTFDLTSRVWHAMDGNPLDHLANLGIQLDPSARTHFKMSHTGELQLTLETTNTADEVKFADYLDIIAQEKSFQSKIEIKTIEIPAGSDWSLPETDSLDPQQEQTLLRDLAQRARADLLTMPSVTARNGEEASIELIRELILPVDPADESSGFETHYPGVVARIQPSPMGFGYQSNLSFRVTEADFERAEGPLVYDSVSITDHGFAGNASTRLISETREDGSRFLLLFKPTKIDPTGRPLPVE